MLIRRFCHINAVLLTFYIVLIFSVAIALPRKTKPTRTTRTTRTTKSSRRTTCDSTDPEDCAEAAMHPNFSQNINMHNTRNQENTKSYWLQLGKDFIRQKSQTQINEKLAKNIILFLGDGMGLTTMAAARNLLGGEQSQLSFEKFPYSGLTKTYALDRIVPDSASTATAYLCGIKANYGTIGVNGHVQRDDCEAMRNTSNHVHSIAKWALDAGKSAGLVTTARVTHASPAGVYAHTADRQWENDNDLTEDCGKNNDLPDIARQLIEGEVGSKLKVVLGGGKKMFLDGIFDKKGLRKDGRNLIAEFLEQSTNNVYVQTKNELFNVDVKNTERLLGLFKNGHMTYHLEALEDKKNEEPTLAEMTQKAIELMQNEKNGYFLFVEGAKIDMAHHDTTTRLALDETLEFSKAIQVAKAMTNEADTLIVVTADHSHTFSLAGYQPRGSDIFSFATSTATDDKSYLTLSYANGPSFADYYNTKKNKRRKPQKVLTNNIDDVFPATVPIESETHSGEDTTVYATGPWAHLFTGVYEQNVLPHMMAYAACIGKGLKACDDNSL